MKRLLFPFAILGASLVLGGCSGGEEAAIAPQPIDEAKMKETRSQIPSEARKAIDAGAQRDAAEASSRGAAKTGP